jgi:lipid-A-disaccharide synthase
VLFTAFEPSGDDHASAVIAELKKRHPDLPVYAWGGPKMRAAGAEVVQLTGADAVMGLPGVQKILEHRRINRDIAEWIAAHPNVRLHVPVDSPAANFPICSIAKQHGLTVIHLVAPQLWAWGPWRINKLRRLTDLVLCLLPFEEPFFRQRGVPARFIGHPLFDEQVPTEELSARAESLPDGRPRVAMLPGSRPGEIAKNFPLLLGAYKELAKGRPKMRGLVAATTEGVRENLYQHASALGGWPDGLDVRVAETDLVAHWADLALVVSGTVTLQLARHGTPMVIVYKSSRAMYNLVGRWVITTEHFTLPNLIAGREVVPELVPHFEGPDALVRTAEGLLNSQSAMDAQREALASVVSRFRGRRASHDAATAIEQTLGLTGGGRSASTPALGDQSQPASSRHQSGADDDGSHGDAGTPRSEHAGA